MKTAEEAARSEGWVRDGDNGGIIYNTNDYGSWKEAVSWSPRDGSIYDTWEECCDHESIDYDDGTSGQDRDSYSDDQDRDSYTVDP
jgi:hypothetical protein